METPKWNFESTSDVYEPAEDSFLLLDALEEDLHNIRELCPKVIVEIGSGSGVIITALANVLRTSAFCLAIDINNSACAVTKETSTLNSVEVDVVQGDLLSCVKACGVIDVLIFNPPYVVTPDDEIAGSIQRSWAGGANGRLVIDRLIEQMNPHLSPKSFFYLVLIKENNPEEVLVNMMEKGFTGKQLKFRKVRGEQLSVFRFTKI
ncbi:methyltransferase N6AMT1-like [Macrosteles quadrilineatus]|uniref:methyltransferase N6AMT1-like n=1 Tax=Macrosteles quadrilineatus TaxID=74068 RepID=UPI0023E2BACC|nr:methyltransferase N6AMT1-like [Macrosteles quadrilineatus]XP_054290289.1 methyltransferase N6AMT1-like [Macrosteles quadrilineatus]